MRRVAFGSRKPEPQNSAVRVQPRGDHSTEERARPGAQPAHSRSRTDGPDLPPSAAESSKGGGKRRSAALSARIGSLVRAIEENDEAKIEEAILRLSRSRRVLSPLAFAVGAFVMLFDGLRLLVANWRLTLVQILSPCDWEGGERGIAALPGREADFTMQSEPMTESDRKAYEAAAAAGVH